MGKNVIGISQTQGTHPTHPTFTLIEINIYRLYEPVRVHMAPYLNPTGFLRFRVSRVSRIAVAQW